MKSDRFVFARESQVARRASGRLLLGARQGPTWSPRAGMGIFVRGIAKHYKLGKIIGECVPSSPPLPENPVPAVRQQAQQMRWRRRRHTCGAARSRIASAPSRASHKRACYLLAGDHLPWSRWAYVSRRVSAWHSRCVRAIVPMVVIAAHGCHRCRARLWHFGSWGAGVVYTLRMHAQCALCKQTQ